MCIFKLTKIDISSHWRGMAILKRNSLFPSFRQLHTRMLVVILCNNSGTSEKCPIALHYQNQRGGWNHRRQPSPPACQTTLHFPLKDETHKTGPRERIWPSWTIPVRSGGWKDVRGAATATTPSKSQITRYDFPNGLGRNWLCSIDFFAECHRYFCISVFLALHPMN